MADQPSADAEEDGDEERKEVLEVHRPPPSISRARAGVALGAKRPEYDLIPVPPAPGFGDSIGAMTIAGGIMGALFHRERTGEATVVDVSLLGTGLWSMGQAIALF